MNIIKHTNKVGFSLAEMGFSRNEQFSLYQLLANLLCFCNLPVVRYADYFYYKSLTTKISVSYV